MSQPILDIVDLKVEFPSDTGHVVAVENANLTIAPNQVHALVGESGSGKSQTARAVLGLLEPPGRITAGQINFALDGDKTVDIAKLDPRGADIRSLRGGEIGMVFQEPGTSLSPMHTVGFQISEALRLHRGLNKAEAWEAAIDLLREVRIPRPELRVKAYPFELSGGMQQRAMIAIALAGAPKLLIADEPTTALDVTTQAQVLDLLREIQSERDMAVLFITHDLGVVADLADEVSVMQKGHIVENKPVFELFESPEDPYTQRLLAATPTLGKNSEHSNGLLTNGDTPLVQVDNLVMRYPLKTGFLGFGRDYLNAVNNVSLSIYPSETLGVVGESGCGKSTLAKAMLRVIKPTAGSITHRLVSDAEGQNVAVVDEANLVDYRKQMRMVFQNPYASLNPRMTIREILREPLRGTDKTSDDHLAHLLELVGLERAHLERYPHAFSGGQRQRIGIARAVATDPQVVLADEAVSSLDVSVRAQILDLMSSLQRDRGLSFMFISHDMSTVEHLSDRVAVMYLGAIVETAPTEDLFSAPLHPYTQTLLSAVPIADPVLQRGREKAEVSGELPDPTEMKEGCAFRNRCPFAQQRCATERPELRPIGLEEGQEPGRSTRFAACHFAEELELMGIPS